MKKTIVFTLLSIVMLAGCTTKDTSFKITDDMKIAHQTDLSVEDGADSVEREGDHLDSRYFPKNDFYNMKSDDTLTILSNFKTIQQSSEWSCGPASALMVMEYLGTRNNASEEDIAALRPQGLKPGATSLQEMIEIFEKQGSYDMESAYDFESIEALDEAFTLDTIQEYLKAGLPIMIGYNDWGGHWQVIIGYDTMGTETYQDDVIIVADPYDTTDHNQDGYGVYPAERFIYNFTFYNFFDEAEGENNNYKQFLVVKPR